LGFSFRSLRFFRLGFFDFEFPHRLNRFRDELGNGPVKLSLGFLFDVFVGFDWEADRKFNARVVWHGNTSSNSVLPVAIIFLQGGGITYSFLFDRRINKGAAGRNLFSTA